MGFFPGSKNTPKNTPAQAHHRHAKPPKNSDLNRLIQATTGHQTTTLTPNPTGAAQATTGKPLQAQATTGAAQENHHKPLQARHRHASTGTLQAHRHRRTAPPAQAHQTTARQRIKHRRTGATTAQAQKNPTAPGLGVNVPN